MRLQHANEPNETTPTIIEHGETADVRTLPVTAPYAPNRHSGTTVDGLLASLKTQARRQRMLRMAAAASGVPTILLLILASLSVFYPAAGHWMRFITPFVFHTTAAHVVQAAPFGHGNAGITTVTRINTTNILALVIGCSLLSGLAQWQRKRVSRLLAQQDDVRAVGALAEALHFKDKRVRREASAALVRLLPFLKPEDGDRLDAKQRACLHRAVDGKEPALTQAILLGFEQIGNPDDLKALERWSKWEIQADESLRTMTASSLSRLRLRLETEQQRQALLRPSSAPTTAADSLLRPAEGVSGIDPTHMLRSSNTP